MRKQVTKTAKTSQYIQRLRTFLPRYMDAIAAYLETMPLK